MEELEKKFCTNSCYFNLLHAFTVQLHVSIIIRGKNCGDSHSAHNCLLCLLSQTHFKATRRFHCVVTERARGACNDIDRIMHNSFTFAPYTAHKAQMWVMVAFLYKEIMMFLLATPHNSNQLLNQNASKIQEKKKKVEIILKGFGK